MDTSSLAYVPTPSQLEQFSEDGYIILRDVLSPEMVKELRSVLDAVEARHRDYSNADPSKRISMFDIFQRHDMFVELIDQPKVLPFIWTLFGDAIQVYFSQLVIYPPEGDSPQPQQDLHRDGVAVRNDFNREDIWPQPMMSLKAAFWFNDVPTPEHGAIRLIPGSHKRQYEIKDVDGATDIEHLCVNAGDVTLHDRRIIHSRGLNTSDAVRRTVFIGYSYRWLRMLGDGLVPDRVIEKCDPIRQQLLGAQFGWNSYYEPELQEPLPLRSWLADQGITETHKGERI